MRRDVTARRSTIKMMHLDGMQDNCCLRKERIAIPLSCGLVDASSSIKVIVRFFFFTAFASVRSGSQA